MTKKIKQNKPKIRRESFVFMLFRTLNDTIDNFIDRYLERSRAKHGELKGIGLILGIFSDGMTRIAALFLLVILILLIFSFTSSMPLEHPLFGVFLYSLVPILFIGGGIVFVLTILRFSK